MDLVGSIRRSREYGMFRMGLLSMEDECMSPEMMGSSKNWMIFTMMLLGWDTLDDLQWWYWWPGMCYEGY
jgi:hypothetical protein